MHVSPPHRSLSRTRARAAFAAAMLSSAGTVAFALAPPAQAQGDQTIRRVAGTNAVVDARGDRWAPARDVFQGGRNVRVFGWEPYTGSPGLYRYAKLGVRTIRLRVPRPGRYAVVLYLAEPTERSHRRRFDIYDGGRRVRRNVDVFVRGRERRVLHAIVETVVRGRTIRLKLRGRSGGAPVVSAVSATRLGATSMPAVRPVWQEDFNGPAGAPIGSGWTHETGAEFAHDEQQAYTDRTDNAALDGQGNLAITARHETYTIGGMTRSWTSGRVRLLAPLQLRRAEVTGRIRFPSASGLWATFWLYGLEPPPWPYNGEANVVEYNGNVPRTHHTFFHFGRAQGAGGMDGQFTGHTTLGQPLSSGFHEYGVKTVPGAMEFRFDGRRHASVTSADIPKGGQWPLNNQFNLILSLAVGGDFLKDRTPAPSELPASLVIDRLSYGQ